jgi:PKD repeat protein
MNNTIKSFLIWLLVVTSQNLWAARSSELGSVTLNDTIVFDLSQATFVTENSVTYMEFPVLLNSLDPQINAVDFWFQFDLSKLTYVSTTATVGSFDVYSNFNSTNEYLSNTSSTSSIAVFLPLNVPIIKLKFSLVNPCDQISENDFYNQNALLNGIVSVSEFITPAANEGIAVNTTLPACANTDVLFSYSSTVNGQSIVSYDWDFGNDSLGTSQSESTTYAADGIFDVTLNTTTAAGCEYSFDTQVEIIAAPQLAFTADYDQTSGIVTFTNLSTISSGSIVEFFWEFGDDTTSDLFEPTHTYPADGFYTATLSATSDQGCTSSLIQLVDASVSVKDIEKNGEFSIYPNPAGNACFVRSNATLEYYVIDDLGRRVSETSLIVSNQEKSLDLSALASGLYMIVAWNEEINIVKRIEVQR